MSDKTTATVPAAPGRPRAGRAEREFTVRERSQLRQALRRFFRHRLAVASLTVFGLLVLFAFVTPLFWKYSYTTITPDNSQAPSLSHPFGTDNLGHDMFAQVLRGLQQSIKVALSIALIATVAGTLWGVISGYFRGVVDTALMRVADLVLTIPALALAAALANNFGGQWWMIAVILGSTLYSTTLLIASTLLPQMQGTMGATADEIAARRNKPLREKRCGQAFQRAPRLAGSGPAR